jgi:hypothetical protein
MEKEKSQPVTRLQLERNAEPGGGAAMAAETLDEKSTRPSKKAMKAKPRKSAAAHEAGNDGPKQNPKKFREQRSDPYVKQTREHEAGHEGPKHHAKGFREQRSEPSVQGQSLINEQPMDKQQQANRPASERGAGAY